MAKNEILDFLNRIQSYFVNDYKSMENNKLEHGKCGVPVLLYSFSVIDLIAYLKFGTPSRRDYDVKLRLFNLLDDNGYTTGFNDIPDKNIFYKKIRCGTVHEFLAKGVIIKRGDTNDSMYENNMVNVDRVWKWADNILNLFIEEVKKADQSVIGRIHSNYLELKNDWSSVNSFTGTEPLSGLNTTMTV